MRRRELLLTGATAAAAPLLLRAGSAPAATATAADDDFAASVLANADANFQTLFAFGAIGYGAAEFGEVTTAIDATRKGGGGYDALSGAFSGLAANVLRLGDAARKRGDEVTARDAYLRAAKYLTLPLFFALGTRDRSTARQRAIYRDMNRAWTGAARRFGYTPVRVPYGRSWLPAWFLAPDGPRRRRPTVILNNGNDAQNVDLFAWGGAAAVQRGWNALIFEGPGQGAMWFERGVPFRPDWEQVVTPIVDYLRDRRDVDPARIAIVGWSQGGELVARAAAHERRLAAVVLDPGVLNVGNAVPIPDQLRALVRAGKKAEANAEWAQVFPALPAATQFAYSKLVLPFGLPTFYDQMHALMTYDVTNLVAKIRVPTLVSQYELETAFPGEGKLVYDRLTTARKRFVGFTSAEGAQYHCAPMAPQRRNEVFFDWLDTMLR